MREEELSQAITGRLFLLPRYHLQAESGMHLAFLAGWEKT
jgi:hypothetical protein